MEISVIGRTVQFGIGCFEVRLVGNRRLSLDRSVGRLVTGQFVGDRMERVIVCPNLMEIIIYSLRQTINLKLNGKS